MADIDINLKNSLRSLRTKLGYTQEESAKLLGISAVTLRGWETESGNIKIDFIKKIEELYNTRQEYIYFGNEAEFARLLRRTPSMSLSKTASGVFCSLILIKQVSTIIASMMILQAIQGIAT